MSKIKVVVLFIVLVSCSVLFGTNNALNFSGWANVDCGTPAPLQLLGNFTMEAWIKPTSSGFSDINSIMGNRDAGDYGSGVAFHVNDWGNTNTKLNLVVESQGSKARTHDGVITRGIWQHVAVTYDGTDIKFYINGVQVPTLHNAYTSSVPEKPFKIGVMGGDYYGFNGAIDDVRVWSIARDATMIAENHNRELLGTETGLIAYYKFDEGTGTTVADASSNGLHAAFGTYVPAWIPSPIVMEETLPVTLSSFTAIQTNNNLAQISWVTASENSVLGYHLYRAEADNQNEAIRITPTIIEAHNEATGASYSYVDKEVEFDLTYYYWLQTNDFDGASEMVGPVTVKISTDENNDIEEILLGTQLFANYPNPFNPSTTISFSVAEPQLVTIDVYNIKGQFVQQIFNSNVAEINVKHNVVWNGQDSKGHGAASGVYFTIMKAGNKRFTNKAILMK